MCADLHASQVKCMYYDGMIMVGIGEMELLATLVWFNLDGSVGKVYK